MNKLKIVEYNGVGSIIFIAYLLFVVLKFWLKEKKEQQKTHLFQFSFPQILEFTIYWNYLFLQIPELSNS